MPMPPVHPGEFIVAVYLEPNKISGRELAAALGVAASTLRRFLKGMRGLTPDMALRLSKALGRSPESWLTMQQRHDLWLARQRVDLEKVEQVRLTPIDHFEELAARTEKRFAHEGVTATDVKNAVKWARF